MRRFTTSIEIGAPADHVFDVMTGVERWHEWTPSITSIRRLDQGPFGIGSKAMVRQPRLPPAVWKVTAIAPGRSFTWVSRAPGIQVTGIHTVDPMTTGSRATLTVIYEGLLGALFARLTQAITERYIGYEARGLKARSENVHFHHSGLT